MARTKKPTLSVVPPAPPSPALGGSLVDSIDEDAAALEAATGAPPPELRNTPVPAEAMTEDEMSADTVRREMRAAERREASQRRAELRSTPPPQTYVDSTEGGGEILVPHERLRPPLVQRDKGDLADLTASIQHHGLHNAIIVTPVIERDGSTAYRIVQGSRRSTASARTGATKIRARVKHYASEADEIFACADENMNRLDFAPLEEARLFDRLLGLGLAVPRIAEQFNRTPPHVAQRVRLLNLSSECQAALAASQITLQVALEIARIPVHDDQREVLQDVAGDDDGHPPAPIAYVRESINTRYRLKLDRAPWNLNDAALVPAAGACSVCPKQTGAQAMLFPDVKTALCIDRVCWRSKLDAHWMARVLDTPKTGERLVEGKKAEKALQSMTRLDGDIYSAAAQKVVSVRHVLGDNVPPATIARHPETGEHVTLVPTADVERAITEALTEQSDEEGRVPGYVDDDQADDEEAPPPAASGPNPADDIKKKLRVRDRAITFAEGRACKEKPAVVIGLLSRWLLMAAHSRALEAVAKRHRVDGSAKELPEKMLSWFEGLPPGNRQGLGVEIALLLAIDRGAGGQEFVDRVFAALEVDLGEMQKALEFEDAQVAEAGKHPGAQPSKPEKPKRARFRGAPS